MAGKYPQKTKRKEYKMDLYETPKRGKNLFKKKQYPPILETNPEFGKSQSETSALYASLGDTSTIAQEERKVRKLASADGVDNSTPQPKKLTPEEEIAAMSAPITSVAFGLTGSSSTSGSNNIPEQNYVKQK